MKATTKKTLSYYLEYAFHYRVAVIGAVLGVAGASLLTVAIPLFFKQFIDIASTHARETTVVWELIHILVFIALLEFVQWLFWRIATFSSSYFESNIIADLADMCFAYLHKHSFAFFDNNFGGSLVKKVKWFANAFEAISDRFLFDLLPLVLNITLIIFVLFQRNSWLGFGIIVWVIIFVTINSVFTNFKLGHDIRRSKAETRATGLLADTISNHSVIRLFNGYFREIRSFARANKEFKDIRLYTWNLSNVFEAVQGFLMIILEIGIMIYAVFLWKKNVLTIGDFFLIQTYLLNIFRYIWDFGRVIRNIYERLADAEEMTIVLTTPHDIKDVRGAKDLAVSEGRVEFLNVSFFYNQTRTVLDNFAVTIQPHEHVALVGPSGSGKTTAIKLLLRMYDVSGGKIKVDGQDISKVTQESIWRSISLVPQDPSLFHRSLMDNIRYGKPDASDSQVIRAAKQARCHEFIKSFPDGYKTFVGERGVKLSGGERQRIAIARAILRNAPILVFDEATSNLDSESEMLIQEALVDLMAGKTVMVIAHRLSTIKKMDRIIIIENGTVVDEGTHDNLLQHNKGIYKKLWSIQAGGFI